MIDKVKDIDCTGCFACYNVCPTNCISMERDVEGFVYPRIDKSLCIECNLCEEICPSVYPVDSSSKYMNPEVYAAWSTNEEIRLDSTSGGIFSELALKILRSGGYVCGAKYNSNHMVEHCIINDEKDLYKIRQSKYVQSDIWSIFNSIKNLLIQGKFVLFCGTPCECAGLLNLLGKEYENLIIIDFICRGSNSPEIYRRFLDKLKEQYESNISRVWFKNKTYGWNRFSTKIEFENGKYYLEDRFSDLYIRGYIEANLYMRLCCSECKYKTFPRVSDLTLGDFWGIKLSDISKDIEKGTSLIMVNSVKGEELFDSIKSNIFFKKKSMEDALRRNMCITTSAKQNPRKEEFISSLDNMDILQNIKQFCKKR